MKTIICVSRPTMAQFGACPEKLRQIHDAIDLDEFDAGTSKPVLRRELGLDAEAVIFGSHGRVLPRKGYIELIRAAHIVLNKLDAGARANCHFVVVGDTPQDLQPDHLEECRALVKALGLTDNVHFIGFRAVVTSYIADFDVAVVPSIYQDPLPLAVLEAMAMEKPVVAFNVGGMAEMIEDGISGRLAPGLPPDIAALANFCLGYLADADMRRRDGAAARRRAEQQFDAKAHARLIENELFRAAGTA